MIKYLHWEDVPESWLDRTSGEGYKRGLDSDGNRVYLDNGLPIDVGFRPCAKCNEFPTKDGHDSCLGELGRVLNACCGHGVNDGYIQFENGVRISGKFTVERWK